MKRIDVDQLKTEATGRWPEILAAMAGIPTEYLDGRHHPCPKCEGDDRFRLIAEERGAVRCNQCFSDKCGDGFAAIMWMLGVRFPEAVQLVADYLGTSLAPTTTRPVRKEQRKTDEELDAWLSPLVEKWERQHRDQWCGHLATSLGVTPVSLRQLHVGWDGQAWTFPEWNASRQIVGVSRRLANGRKLAVKGASRGLVYPANWKHLPGSVLVVEGGSDTAAVLSMGLCGVGRPSNVGGRRHLVELLAGCKRKVIVVGERDRKPCNCEGGCRRCGGSGYEWPGWEGAVVIAKSLAQAEIKDVVARLMPDNAKDLRAWLLGTGLDPREAGRRLEREFR